MFPHQEIHFSRAELRSPHHLRTWSTDRHTIHISVSLSAIITSFQKNLQKFTASTIMVVVEKLLISWNCELHKPYWFLVFIILKNMEGLNNNPVNVLMDLKGVCHGTSLAPVIPTTYSFSNQPSFLFHQLGVWRWWLGGSELSRIYF